MPLIFTRSTRVAHAKMLTIAPFTVHLFQPLLIADRFMHRSQGKKEWNNRVVDGHPNIRPSYLVLVIKEATARANGWAGSSWSMSSLRQQPVH
jgi:hypothetical protein